MINNSFIKASLLVILLFSTLSSTLQGAIDSEALVRPACVVLARGAYCSCCMVGIACGLVGLESHKKLNKIEEDFGSYRLTKKAATPDELIIQWLHKRVRQKRNTLYAGMAFWSALGITFGMIEELLLPDAPV